MAHAHTHSPWSRVVLEKLTGSHIVKYSPHFMEPQRFFTVVRSSRHLRLSWAKSIQSMPAPPRSTSWKSILILSSPLRQGLPSGVLPSGVPTKTLYEPRLFPHTFCMPSPSHSSVSDHPNNMFAYYFWLTAWWFSLGHSPYAVSQWQWSL